MCAGGNVARQGGIARHELLPDGCLHVTPGIGAGVVWIPGKQVPVRGTQDDARVIGFLQILLLRAAGMVGMAMADNHVPDLRRVQPELLHSFRSFRFGGITEQDIDRDDAAGSCHCP